MFNPFLVLDFYNSSHLKWGVMNWHLTVPSVSNYKHIPSGCAELETEGNAVVVQCKHTLKGCAYNWHSTVLHTIRIVRPSVASLPIPSEHDLDDYVADTTIENGGTVDELHAKINQLLTNYFAK